METRCLEDIYFKVKPQSPNKWYIQGYTEPSIADTLCSPGITDASAPPHFMVGLFWLYSVLIGVFLVSESMSMLLVWFRTITEEKCIVIFVCIGLMVLCSSAGPNNWSISIRILIFQNINGPCIPVSKQCWTNNEGFGSNIVSTVGVKQSSLLVI